MLENRKSKGCVGKDLPETSQVSILINSKKNYAVYSSLGDSNPHVIEMIIILAPGD